MAFRHLGMLAWSLGPELDQGSVEELGHILARQPFLAVRNQDTHNTEVADPVGHDLSLIHISEPTRPY